MTADQTARPNLARVSRIHGAERDLSLCRAACASFSELVDAPRRWCVYLASVCLRPPNLPLRRPCVGAWASYPAAVLVGMAWGPLRRREAWAMAVGLAITLQEGPRAVLRAVLRVALSKRYVVAAVPRQLVGLHVRVRVGAPGARYVRINVLPPMSEPVQAVSRATCTVPTKRMYAHEPAELGAAARPILPGVE